MTIQSIEPVSVSEEATVVGVNCAAFMIQNLSESAIVYMKESAYDGAMATENNGFAIFPGETLDKVLRARQLSLWAATNAEVRIMFLS